MHRGLFRDVRYLNGRMFRDHCWIVLNSEALRRFDGLVGKQLQFSAEPYVYGWIRRKIGLQRPQKLGRHQRCSGKRADHQQLAREMPLETFPWD
jgi:hypothetical protein